MKQKNILVLVEHFGQGGAERVAAMVANMLKEDPDFQVHLYSVYQPANGNGHSLQIPLPRNIFQKIYFYYLKIARLSRLKRKLDTDITISSLWPVDWINALAGRDKKIAVIQINVLNNQQNASMVRLRRLVSSIYNRFDAIVLGGANLKPELTGFFQVEEKKIRVIQNPIDARLIEKNLKEALPPALEKLFGSYQVCTAANRLHAIKNNETLPFIYKRLNKRQDLKFLIIGEGEEKAGIQRAIEGQGLRWCQLEEGLDEEAAFYFLNFQKNIHNIISRSRLFLFPTKGEGLPLALLEAMYCGTPAIVSDCPNGGISETMQAAQPFDAQQPRQQAERTAYGYLMPLPSTSDGKSLDEWKDKIEELLSAGEEELRRISAAERSRALQFDREHIGAEWRQLVQNLLKQP